MKASLSCLAFDTRTLRKFEWEVGEKDGGRVENVIFN